MPLKIAQQTLTWMRHPEKFTVEQKINEVREAGYEGIEFMEPLDELGSADHLRQNLQNHSLALASLSTVIGLGDGKRLDEAKRRVEYAANFGISSLMLCGGFPGEGVELDESHFRVLGEEIEQLCQHAGEFNMNVAFHPHIGCRVETKEDVDRLLQYAPSVKLCPDTAHLQAKGSNPVQFLEEYKDRIVYVHLKDWKQSKKVDNYWEHFVELGEGDLGIDFPGFLRKLEEIGYEGWVAVELDWTTRTPLESAKISREYLRKIGY